MLKATFFVILAFVPTPVALIGISLEKNFVGEMKKIHVSMKILKVRRNVAFFGYAIQILGKYALCKNLKR